MEVFIKTHLNLALLVTIIVTVILTSTDCTKFAGKDITHILFGSHNEEIFPAAYGDFNADKLTDVFAVARDHSELLIYFAREESPILYLGIRCKIRTKSISNPNGDKDLVHIVGVSPGDFDGDGLLDVMVAFHSQETNDTQVEVTVFPGNLTTLDCSGASKSNTTKMVQEPLMLDLNGDMVMDLFGEIYGDSCDNSSLQNCTHKEKYGWIYNKGGQFHPTRVKFNVNNVDSEIEDYVDDHLAIPNSNSFVDTNGDLVPELVLITTNKKTTYSQLHDSGILYDVKRFNLNFTSFGDRNPSFDYLGKTSVSKVPGQIPIVGQSLFFDLNQNGQLMHVLPYSNKDGKNSGLKVIPPTRNGDPIELPISFVDPGGNDWHFLSRRKEKRLNSNYTSSIVLRIGDYNLDGYPDLIGVLVKKEAGGTTPPTRAVLFENVACETKPQSECKFPRTFNLNFDALSHYENVTLATFFDIHEDGLVDVVLVKRTNTDQHPTKDKYGAFAIQNSPDYDANFMKVMVLSPQPCPFCPKSNVPYGNIISGPIIDYKTTTQAGIHQTAVAAQMYRSSYMPLDLPYTIFGIGQSPNFIETLRVSVCPSVRHNHSQEWLQIIPNSQIFVVPTPPEKPWLWSAKLFLTPSKAVLDTFGVLLGFCGLIALLVGGLQYKERREDRKERLEEANRFHMM